MTILDFYAHSAGSLEWYYDDEAEKPVSACFVGYLSLSEA